MGIFGPRKSISVLKMQRNNMAKKTLQESDIARTFALEEGSRRRRRFTRWLIVIVFIGGGLAAGLGFRPTHQAKKVQYRTQEARRGDIIVNVTATGNLQPTNEVEVGSELSGIVRSVLVDYNDKVAVGQALAKLDTLKLEAQNLQYKGGLASAKAKVRQAQATVREARNNLSRLKRVRELSGNKVPSQYDLDAAEATLDRGLADEASAAASVSQAQAALKANETDLDKAVIRSPIKGIVLTRDVEPGQTVAASLQAPVLFILAEDLTQMELHVDVDEADVGQVRVGQEATFTVDAYPERAFRALITQVRYGATTTDNVVTYETVLKVENTDLSLRPGMTATADITVNKVQDVLLIPNAALRFKPPETKKADSGRGLVGLLLPRPPRQRNEKNREPKGNSNHQQVWTLRGEQLFPLVVTLGGTDGVMTEVTSGNIALGTALVVD
jgi:HlyD family secretion protein